ncbi:MAG: FAD-binding oxidoreductase [Candidatus Micrarchaeota archaeon]
MIIKKPYYISEIIKETPDVTIFRFKSADGSVLDFSPGMFIMLYYKANTPDEIGRAYSIASAPGSDTIELIISMIHGRLTSKLEEAKVGDIYHISGPYGQFKFDPSKNKKVLFIAGGTGLAPFLSMLRYIKQKNLGIDVALMYSVRYPNEIIRRAELEEFEKSLNMKLVITVTRPQPGDNWSGETGHINEDMIKRNVPDFMERDPYICGPLAFTNAMKQALINIGVDVAKIKADVWG